MIVLADLHGNLEALEAILAGTSATRPVLCLGDVLGRAGRHEACVRRLSRRDRTVCVRGNHEERALSSGGASVTHGPLAGETLDRLGDWPRVHRASGWTACHAAPADPRGYLFDRPAIADVLSAVDAPVLFSAHTHRPMWFGGSRAEDLTERPVRPGVTHEFDPRRRHFLNPGSASQPLATDHPPTYLEVDWAKGTLRWEALPSVERARPGFP